MQTQPHNPTMLTDSDQLRERLGQDISQVDTILKEKIYARDRGDKESDAKSILEIFTRSNVRLESLKGSELFHLFRGSITRSYHPLDAVTILTLTDYLDDTEKKGVPWVDVIRIAGLVITLSDYVIHRNPLAANRIAERGISSNFITGFEQAVNDMAVEEGLPQPVRLEVDQAYLIAGKFLANADAQFTELPELIRALFTSLLCRQILLANAPHTTPSNELVK